MIGLRLPLRVTLGAVLPAPTWRALVSGLVLGAAGAAGATAPVVADYMLACQGCHLPDGSGYPARGVPAFPGFVGRFLHVDGGREFLIRVPGVAQSGLPDERLATLMNWLLTRFSPAELPRNFRPYTAAEVAQLRHQPLADVTATRNLLVRRMAQPAATTQAH